MRIKIIICGWWYDKFDHRENLTEFIEGLISLNKDNNNIDVFWACHKEPIDLVKNNFEWKLYENVGLEWGAYNKAFNELEFEDDDYVFCIQDDMVIKDWSFIKVCIKYLSNDEIKIIGNGFNYPYNMEPQEEARLSYWLNRSVNSDNKKYANYKWIDYVRPENQHMFNEKINCLSIRGSFLATRWKHIKLINGFEYVDIPLCEGIKEDGTQFLLTDPFGNTSLYLNAYKFSKYFGPDSFKWLSNTYRKSKWMIECGRGNINLAKNNNKKPFNIPKEYLVDGYEYEEDVTISVKPFRGATYEQFTAFLNSLKDEKETWDLDLKTMSSPKEFFEYYCQTGMGLVAMLDDEIIGIVNSFIINKGVKMTSDSEDLQPQIAEISICVKSGIQKRGVGTALMTAYDQVCKLNNIKFVYAKHYKNNAASSKLFTKAGYIPFEWSTEKANKAWDFKMKEYE